MPFNSHFDSRHAILKINELRLYKIRRDDSSAQRVAAMVLRSLRSRMNRDRAHLTDRRQACETSGRDSRVSGPILFKYQGDARSLAFCEVGNHARH